MKKILIIRLDEDEEGIFFDISGRDANPILKKYEEICHQARLKEDDLDSISDAENLKVLGDRPDILAMLNKAGFDRIEIDTFENHQVSQPWCWVKRSPFS